MDNNNDNDIKINAINHKDLSLKRLNQSFEKHINLEEYKKSDILAYWVHDFSNYHDNEKSFDSSKLRRYKRGDIIKANLGFNIGGELGGLHYCIVINKDDKPSFGTLNVIPLTSIKEGKVYYNNTVNLGDEIYTNLYEKFQRSFNNTFNKLSSISKSAINNYSDIKDELDQISVLSQELEFLKKFEKEILKMKKGSIALLNQITTISKQRIFYPKTSKDLLAGIHLSNHTLDLLDKKLINLFTK